MSVKHFQFVRKILMAPQDTSPLPVQSPKMVLSALLTLPLSLYSARFIIHDEVGFCFAVLQ
ncbi:hypothetical protein DCC62_32860 [candidate division KSB1 bacterium]|nr:MAG: hypothetical protein DCC62_32860 [candidate division KSB1 bacterium]